MDPVAQAASLLAECGITLDGPAPTDLQVHDRRFFGRVLAHGSLGLGESYMDGWWDVECLEGFLARLLEARLDARLRTFDDRLMNWRARVFDLQTPRRALAVARRHYDIGNDLFAAMLGRRLVYSCGYWRDADGLDAAQEAKLDLVCRKLGLRPGMRVLDVGCGWGDALAFAAERYGVSGVGVTLSVEQAEGARARCRRWPIEIRVADYRTLDERFDAVYSIGMFEHVGPRHHREYFEVVRRCLAARGLSLLHTIGTNEAPARQDPWIARYVFPNSAIPAARQVAQALEGLFVVEDWHNFGQDYETTLRAWRDNIERAWRRLPDYDERFRRMWRYYLGASIAQFHTRRLQLWQLVLSADGIPGGYVAPR
ncbi:MAG: cyclopropane fatty acyl phospholipid synthase [Myxococcota bacterium]